MIIKEYIDSSSPVGLFLLCDALLSAVTAVNVVVSHLSMAGMGCGSVILLEKVMGSPTLGG